MAELGDVTPSDWKASRQIDRSSTCSKSLHFVSFISSFSNVPARFAKGQRSKVVSKSKERWSRGCCGAALVPTPRCQCCWIPPGAAAINTQHNCQTLMNVWVGYSMDLCLGLVLSQALFGVCCSSHVLQVLPFPQQWQVSGESKKRKEGSLEKSPCCNSLLSWEVTS